ncbi:MAG: HDOD domain-containing protein [Methylococcales bacterium]
MKVQMNQLFDKIHQLPQIPEVVRTLITQFNDPKTNFDDIAKNIEKEQVISLKVLRLVNSAHFGLSRKIGSIQEAVFMLGMNQLRTLVIASGLVSSIPKIEGVDIKSFWSKSFNTATYAKWLAAESQVAPDLAFTAGLISHLGNILIHMGAPAAASEIDQHVKGGKSRSAIEKARLGFTSEDVCAELCRRWHFSDELVQTVANSADPLATEDVIKSAHVVYLARYLSENQKNEAVLATFPFDVAKKIGLSEQYIHEHVAEILALESGLDGLVSE